MNAALRFIRLATALACIGWMTPALAEVALSTTVQELERVVAPDGSVSSQLVAPDKVVPGDDMHYTITFRNAGKTAVDAGTVVITNPVPENTTYIGESAFGAGTTILFSVDGGAVFRKANELTVVRDGVEVPASANDYTTIRWTFGPALAPGAQGNVSFNVRLK